MVRPGDGLNYDAYKEDSLKRLWNEGYDPAEAAMETGC